MTITRETIINEIVSGLRSEEYILAIWLEGSDGTNNLIDPPITAIKVYHIQDTSDHLLIDVTFQRAVKCTKRGLFLESLIYYQKYFLPKWC